MPKSIHLRDTSWDAIILMCGKCARKLDGGYGHKGRETLRSVLRGEIRAAEAGTRPRVIETRCLGVCPKDAVAALNAGRPGVLLTIPTGTEPQVALRAIIGT